MVLYWAHKDSELGAHTTGPWDLLWKATASQNKAQDKACQPALLQGLLDLAAGIASSMFA